MANSLKIFVLSLILSSAIFCILADYDIEDYMFDLWGRVENLEHKISDEDKYDDYYEVQSKESWISRL